jgi:hypothetical protein
VADDKKHQSPEELGEAVGQKIEELFGGIFPEDEPSPTPEPKATPHSAVAPPAIKPVARVGEVSADQSTENLMDRIEALVLQLDWETSVDTVKDLVRLFKELDRKPSGDGPVKFLLNMNGQLLQRLARSGIVPHPSFLNFLQDSISILRRATDTDNPQLPDQAQLAEFKGRFREIMAAAEQRVQGAEDRAPQEYSNLMSEVGGSVRSLEEISQRLARILALFRQGGNMSGEEITRRLGTLDKLLAEHVGTLSDLHDRLSGLQPSAGSGNSGAASQDAQSEGLLLVSWGGSPMAIPLAGIGAMYALTKDQVRPLMDKQTINVGSGPLQRLPLKKPQDRSAASTPNLLVHLSWGKKDYFLLADRALGYRRAPEYRDVSKQKKIKIGPITYALLTPAIFRSSS